MERNVSLEWIRPTRQARSAQTVERLLDATEAILEEKCAEEATVAEIARRAGSSVGSFYARFADKEALLRCVFERFHEQAAATAQAVLQAERWQGIAIVDALETMLGFMLQIVKERRGLIVALLTRAARDPELAGLGQRLHEHISDQLRALIAERDDELDHPDPDAAIGLAVWLVLSALEMRTLYSAAHVERLEDEKLARELARMCMRYLGLPAAEATSSRMARRGAARPRAR